MSTPKRKIFLENKRSYSIRSKDSNCISNNKKKSKPIISKGPWKSPEDQILLDWINKHGPRNWTKCAELIIGRTGKQCREHWNNSLNSEIKKGDWSAEEDLLIMVFYKKFEGSWKRMIPLFKSRTENSIKNRFFSQLRKIASKYIKKAKRVYSTKFGLETLLNYYDLGLKQAKENFLNNSHMSEKELEGYIKSIEIKLKKNTKKGEKFIDLSSLRNNKNKIDNNIKLNESEDESDDKPNNMKNKRTARKRNIYKKIKKENSSDKEINDFDITIKLDNEEEQPQKQSIEKENSKDIVNNNQNDFNKNKNNNNNSNSNKVNNVNNNINNVDKFNILNPNNNNNNILNYGKVTIPVNNNTYNNNLNNVNYSNYNTNFTTNNFDNNMINKNDSVNVINNNNNSLNNYTLNNLRSGAFYVSNISNRFNVEIPNYNNIINKKSSDLSEYTKNNDYLPMENYEKIQKQVTHEDVLKLLNNCNSNNFNDNIDQNNYFNYNGLQSGKISNIYDEKKSFSYIQTPNIEKKISFPAYKNSESFDYQKGPSLLEPQLSQCFFKRNNSNTSI